MYDPDCTCRILLNTPCKGCMVFEDEEEYRVEIYDEDEEE